MSDARAGVLVLGSLNLDLVVSVEAHPHPGDTVLGSDVRTFPGGKGANQAVAAALAGGRVGMLGRIGRDSYGAQLRAALEGSGVEVGALLETSGPSGTAFITVDRQGENTIVVSPGANRRLAPCDVTADHFGGVGVLLLQLESPLETVARATELATERGVVVILNAAPVAPLEDALLERLSLLVVNEGEAAALAGLSGTEGTAAAAERLQERGAEAVVVTLGGEGALWRTPQGGGSLAAHPVEVVDTTAAGDAFCGALAARLAQGESLEAALHFANAAGALAVTRPGAQPSLPTRAETEKFLAQGA